MKNLPYRVKELINLYAIRTLKNYESVFEFNKMIDYEPCEYSPKILSEIYYNYICYVCNQIKTARTYIHISMSKDNIMYYDDFFISFADIHENHDNFFGLDTRKKNLIKIYNYEKFFRIEVFVFGNKVYSRCYEDKNNRVGYGRNDFKICIYESINMMEKMHNDRINLKNTI